MREQRGAVGVAGVGHVNDVVVDAGVGDVAPELHPRASVAPTVVLADAVADGVPAVDVIARRQDVARAVVVVRVVVLHRAVGDVPVEIEPAAVGRGGGVVVVAFAVFDGDAIGPGRPDADRRGAVLAVVVHDAAGDTRAVHVRQVNSRSGHAAHQPAPRAVPRVDVVDQVVLVGVVRRRGNFQSAIQVVVEVGVLDLDVVEAAAGGADEDAHAFASVAADVHVLEVQRRE